MLTKLLAAIILACCKTFLNTNTLSFSLPLCATGEAWLLNVERRVFLFRFFLPSPVSLGVSANACRTCHAWMWRRQRCSLLSASNSLPSTDTCWIWQKRPPSSQQEALSPAILLSWPSTAGLLGTLTIPSVFNGPYLDVSWLVCVCVCACAEQPGESVCVSAACTFACLWPGRGVGQAGRKSAPASLPKILPR